MTTTPTSDGAVGSELRSNPDLVELTVGGMTCSSCSARIQRKLNKLDGVEAEVNYATGAATVRYDAGTVSVDRLIETVEATGYTAALPAGLEADEVDEVGPLRRRTLTCAALALPVLVLAMVPATQFDYWQWVSLALATPVATWGAWPFHQAAWTNLRHRAATMDTLISLGVLAAFGWSLYALLFGGAAGADFRMAFDLLPGRAMHDGAEIYLEVASVVTVFLLAGRWAEARAKGRSGAALQALLAGGAREATILSDGGDNGPVEVVRPADRVAVGDLVLVRPGQTLPADGEVVEGSSAIDTALLTGEPVPVDVTVGDAVAGGTVNTSGRLVVRATRPGTDTALARVARLVREAQAGKAPVQRLADRVSLVFVPVVIGLAVATLIGWLATGHSVEQAFTSAVAVLIIACPCALGLATPTALLVGTGRGAQLGVLIRGPQVLERTRSADVVLLDKTGTVTTGRMTLADAVAVDGTDTDQLLRRAGAVEAASEHPVAAAVAAGARERVGTLPGVEEFANIAGQGVLGTVDGVQVRVGQPALLVDAGMTVGDAAAAELARLRAWADRGAGRLGRGRPRRARRRRPAQAQSAAAVAALRELGLEPVLLTGDHEAAARAVADEVGITEVRAQVLPEDKVAVVRELQAAGRVVAMVGDGVNDAAALAQADLGLAMGTGTDVAIEAGDLTLVRGDLTAAVDAVRLARRTLAVIRGNLFWAFAYNVAALPLAVAGLMNPMIAGVAMARSQRVRGDQLAAAAAVPVGGARYGLTTWASAGSRPPALTRG